MNLHGFQPFTANHGGSEARGLSASVGKTGVLLNDGRSSRMVFIEMFFYNFKVARI